MKIDFYIDLYNNCPTHNIESLKACGLLMSTKPYHKCEDMDRIKVTVDFPNHYFKYMEDTTGIVTDVEVLKEYEQ